MEWYIAIASLVTGFCLGAVIVKYKDIGLLRASQEEFVRLFIKNNDARNDQLKEIFNTERQILLHLLKGKED